MPEAVLGGVGNSTFNAINDESSEAYHETGRDDVHDEEPREKAGEHRRHPVDKQFPDVAT